MQPELSKRFSIRDLSSLHEMAAVVELQAQIWGYGKDDRDHPYPSRALISVSESGGLISGAFSGEELVGFAVAWIGREQTHNRYYLHSQLLGVLPSHRRAGLGLAMKLRQKEFALKSGLSLIRWTFDPLQFVNARFNLRRLGAVVRTYSEDHYGSIRSHLAGDLASDRLWAEWYLTSPRVQAHLEHEPETKYGTLPVLTAEQMKNFALNSSQPNAPQLLVEIPKKFDSMLHAAPDRASEWRRATRAVLGAYLSGGYLLDDCVEERDSAFYHLTNESLQEIVGLSVP
jgi:predicted GNAT superfamily acetyltransferase